MGMNWNSIGEQLRAIGVTVSGAPAAPQDVSKPNELASAHDGDLDEAFNAQRRAQRTMTSCTCSEGRKGARP